jgi:hypothetical protein
MGRKVTRVCGLVRYRMSSSKTSCVSLVHWNLSCFLRTLKMGYLLTPSLEMNLLRAAMHPINFCISWRISSGFMFVIAYTFSRLGSIPHWETIYLSSFPECTPNVHFSVFNFMLNFLRLLKVSTRSEMSPFDSLVFTTTSSMYASALHPSWLWRHYCIPLWYFVPAFLSPKGIIV